MLLALCCWLCAVSSVLLALCCWLCAVSSVLLALCCWLCAVSSVLLALCCWLCAVGSVLLALCCWLCAVGSVLLAIRSCVVAALAASTQHTQDVYIFTCEWHLQLQLQLQLQAINTHRLFIYLRVNGVANRTGVKSGTCVVDDLLLQRVQRH